jgi:hypothetical protein
LLGLSFGAGFDCTFSEGVSFICEPVNALVHVVLEIRDFFFPVYYEGWSKSQLTLDVSLPKIQLCENCAVLAYYAESSGNFLPTFRDNDS